MTAVCLSVAAVALGWLALVGVREWIRAVVATREHAGKEISLLRAELVEERAARAVLVNRQDALTELVKKVQARIPDSPIVPRGPR